MLKILVTAVLTSVLLVGGAFGVYKHQELVVLTQEDQGALQLAFMMQGMAAFSAGAASCKGDI